MCSLCVELMFVRQKSVFSQKKNFGRRHLLVNPYKMVLKSVKTIVCPKYKENERTKLGVVGVP